MHLFRLPLPELLLRVGVALAFLYPPIDALSDPYSWIGYFPAPLADFVAPHGVLLLHTFGVIEVIIALWILFGRNIVIPAATATVMLLAIVAANTNQFPVLFRDVSIACMSAALVALHYKNNGHRS